MEQPLTQHDVIYLSCFFMAYKERFFVIQRRTSKFAKKIQAPVCGLHVADGQKVRWLGAPCRDAGV
jgi:hypothetical protein